MQAEGGEEKCYILAASLHALPLSLAGFQMYFLFIPMPPTI